MEPTRFLIRRHYQIQPRTNSPTICSAAPMRSLNLFSAPVPADGKSTISPRHHISRSFGLVRSYVRVARSCSAGSRDRRAAFAQRMNNVARDWA